MTIFSLIKNQSFMRVVILSLLTGMSALVLAQPKKLQPTVKSATFFPGGVEISMEARADLKPGTHVLHIMGLPQGLTENDLSFDGVGGFTLLSLRLKTEAFLDPAAISSLRPQLEKIEDYHRDIEKLERQIELVRREREMLESNKSIGGQQTLTATVWRDAVNFYQERLRNLMDREEQLLLQHREKRLERYLKGGELASVLYATRNNQKFLEVEIEMSKAGMAEFSVSVLSRQGGWNPQYELRSYFPEEKLEVLHQANFFQQTGNDWKNVKVRFTNAVPYKLSRIPDIADIQRSANSFNQFPPIKTAGYTGTLAGKVTEQNSTMGIPGVNIELIDQYGKVITTHATDEKGYYQINTQEPVFRLKFFTWDFHINSLHPSPEWSQVVLHRRPASMGNVDVFIASPADLGHGGRHASQDSEEQIHVFSAKTLVESSSDSESMRARAAGYRFNPAEVTLDAGAVVVELPGTYDIASSAVARTVKLRALYPENVQYLHVAVPRIGNQVYLSMSIPNAGQLGILTGSARVFIGNRQVGQISIDPQDRRDTLDVTLGEDPLVTSRYIPDFQSSSRRMFSRKITQENAYTLEVINQRNSAIQLEIRDKLPVSSDPEVNLKPIELNGGVFNSATGAIIWRFKAEKGSNKRSVRYEITYPQ